MRHLRSTKSFVVGRGALSSSASLVSSISISHLTGLQSSLHQRTFNIYCRTVFVTTLEFHTLLLHPHDILQVIRN